MLVLPAAGHAVHEDEPEKVAECVLNFLKRFRVGEPPMTFPRASGVPPVLPLVGGPVV
jgi:protein phosphatase methylesterase 1